MTPARATMRAKRKPAFVGRAFRFGTSKRIIAWSVPKCRKKSITAFNFRGVQF